MMEAFRTFLPSYLLIDPATGDEQALLYNQAKKLYMYRMTI